MGCEGGGGAPCVVVVMVARCTRASPVPRWCVWRLRSCGGCSSVRLLRRECTGHPEKAEGMCLGRGFGVGLEFGGRPDTAEPQFPRP